MRHVGILAAAMTAALVVFGCTNAPVSQPAGGGGGDAPKTGKIRIGFSMDTLKEERWQRDRDLFVKHAEALGAEVMVQAANGDDRVQIQQAENLLTQGVDVLVVVPHNSQVAAAIVESAKKQGVPVMAYDRMITNCDLDLYVSYDAVRIGEQQAQYLLGKVPKGNYVVIQGAPSDNNAHVLRQGHMKVLQPAIDRGDVKIVAEQWARDWLASEALNHVENALTQNNNNVQAVLAANDGTAGGVVQALEGQKLTGKVVVTGQDAELAALQRIVQGTQSMTIYKPIEKLAQAAAQAAVSLARKQPVQTTSTLNNGQKDVPALLLETVIVDKDNIRETVVKDGYHSASAIGLQ